MSQQSRRIERLFFRAGSVTLCLLVFFNSLAAALDIPKRTFKSDQYHLEFDYDALFREREVEQGSIVNLMIPGRDYPRITVSTLSSAEDSSGPAIVAWLSRVSESDPKLLRSERRLIADRSASLHEVRYREGGSVLVGLFFDLRIDAQTKYRFWYRDIAASYYTRKPLREQLIAGIRIMKGNDDASREEQHIVDPANKIVQSSADNSSLIGLVLLALLIVVVLIFVRRAR
jgi:hypothetical protein